MSKGRLFRANATGILATVLAGLAGIVLLLAVVRARRDWQVSAAKVEPRVSSWDVARAAVGELTRVQAASEVEGWSRDLVGRALAVFRLAGALILEQPVSQMTQLDEASEADRERPALRAVMAIRRYRGIGIFSNDGSAHRIGATDYP